MKIIDLIKEKLGLDEQDLDKEINIEELNKLQHQLDEVRDNLIAEQEQLKREKADAESKAWAENFQKAREKKLGGVKMRNTLRKQARINPSRLRKLKAEGKI
jgi:hypothetical protein|tara:strand:+ start:121 stop:426 length:306 start_codon:yes stop_codon:yes gene_type:complete